MISHVTYGAAPKMGKESRTNIAQVSASPRRGDRVTRRDDVENGRLAYGVSVQLRVELVQETES